MATLMIPTVAPIHHHTASVSSNDMSTPATMTNKRPKLALKTTALAPSYGSLSRGISANADTQASFTPTTNNTLANQWDLSIRPSPTIRTDSPKPATAKTSTQPYILNLPFGVKSILKNSPASSLQTSISASPRESRRRVFFPQPKKVSFRPNLVDVVENEQYLVKHSDLSSSEEDYSEDDSQVRTPSPPTGKSLISGSECSPPPTRKRKVRREPSSMNEHIKSTVDTERDISTSTRDCKRRKWRWTIAPQIVHSSEDSEAESASQLTTKVDESTESSLESDEDEDSSSTCSQIPATLSTEMILPEIGNMSCDHSTES